MSSEPALNVKVKVMEIQTSVAPTEIWLRDDLENIYMLLFRFFGERVPAGALQFWLVDDAEVRHSGARSHRLRAVVGAARLHGKLCENSLKTHLPGLLLRGFFVVHCEEQGRHGRWRSHGSTVAQPL